MPLPDHLLEQAQHLASRERKRPRQASLKRAVSTAYYALFHLLISEATSNWKRADQRYQLARAFDHGRMKSACDARRSQLRAYFKTSPQPSKELDVAKHLHTVVDTFIQSQQQRNMADYDGSKKWSRNEVSTQIDQVSVAFASWKTIRKEKVAQDHLLQMLLQR